MFSLFYTEGRFFGKLKRPGFCATLSVMKQTSPADRAQNFFILTGLSSLVFAWFALSLGMSGLFFIPFVAFGFALMSTLGLFLLLKTLALLDLPEKTFLLLFMGLACLSALPIEPTVFTGRDQGSIATAAISLSEQHSFRFSSPVIMTFFSAYGPGLAYNFPGFFYTPQGELLTQFPPAYTAWLGSFYGLFGLKGFAIGNSVLLAFSFMSFYFLLRSFLHRLLAFLGTLLFSLSFLPVWFSKFTLTENLALFLFVFLALSIIRFRAEGKFLHYLAALSAAGIFFFTRIEGIVLLPITLLLLGHSQHARSLWKLYPRKSIFAPTFLFLLTFAASFSTMTPFYITIGKALQAFLGNTLEAHSVSSITASSSPLILIFFLYGILVMFVIGFIGIFFLIRKKYFTTLVPFIVALPTFLYFLFPNITPDHPWMLRRYLPTLYPALVFSALIGISLFLSEHRKFPIDIPKSPRRRFIMTLIFVGLFSFQITAWYQGLLTQENPTLLQETEVFARLFGPRDLILIDRNATGSGFAMAAGPLASIFHKNAVYFFNPEDLKKIDRSPYEHTWLVIPTNEAELWEKNLNGYTLHAKQTFAFGSISLGSSSLNRTISLPEAAPFSNTDIIIEIE